MKKLLLPLSLATLLSAHEVVHSSATTYVESREFTNSKQKTDGKVIGVAADVHDENSAYRITYEYGETNTIQPPLTKDLRVQKLFLQYKYEFENGVSARVNYANVLEDNIAPTANGQVFGAGVGYELNKKIVLNGAQYYSLYDDFKVYQSDLKVDYKLKIAQVGVKFTALGHYIKLKDYSNKIFNPNAPTEADSSYKTAALKMHAHYKSYHFGAAYYVGSRLFGVMDDGFKLQHHAMEFDKTYAVGFGKSFSDFIVRVQYVYQRATELPQNNANVEVQNIRVIGNYKF